MMSTGVASPGQVARREAARARLVELGRVTDGWVLLGVDLRYRVMRGAVEHAFTMNLKDGWARFWPEEAHRPGAGLTSALAYVDVYTQDYALGQGLDFAVYEVNSKSCPIVPDWAHLLGEMQRTRPRIVRGRVDRFQTTNIKYLLRPNWLELLHQGVERQWAT